MPQIDAEGLEAAGWRSLRDLDRRCDPVGQIGPEGADDSGWQPSRRDMLKLMGASAALAGLAACRWPEQRIVPFASRPEGRLPGMPDRYATTVEIGGVGRGLLVTCCDGRPIKVEGNANHTESGGATDVFCQAAVLELYDPDRSREFVLREKGKRQVKSRDEFLAVVAALAARLREKGGAGLAVLAEPSSSVSLADLRTRLMQACPQAKWHEWDPLSRDNERAGTSMAFGRPYRVHLALARATAIISLDSDFLMTHPASVHYTRDFASRRRTDNGLSRLTVVEGGHTVTGSMADHRHAVRPDLIPLVAAGLAVEILPASQSAADGVRSACREHAVGFVPELARELLAVGGSSVIVAGPGQPPEVHALVHLVNCALGSAGQTVLYVPEPDPTRPSHLDSLRALCRDLAVGAVDTLLILGGNPVFDAPADLDFARTLAKAPASLRLGLYEDETSQLCTWHVPMAHFLESWGDAGAHDGTISLVQPLILPLYGGMSRDEILSTLVDQPPLPGHDIVRRALSPVWPSDFDTHWQRALHDGVVSETRYAEEIPAAAGGVLDTLLTQAARPPAALSTADVVVLFSPGDSVLDGRYANNAWLQERPDPMTHLTWGNAALVAPRLAAGRGLSDGEVVRLTAGSRSIEVPVFILPGQEISTVTLSLGYGRRSGGRIAEGTGVDAYPLRTAAGMRWAAARMETTGRRVALATTQEHFAIDAVGFRERERRAGMLVRELDRPEHPARPPAEKDEGHALPLISLWKEHLSAGHRWGMAIDLSACTGCGVCVVACQAENNIPVVGKDQVARGREMHWMRVDRYFVGPPDSPRTLHQPVACQQCENAPCEQVCPVGATQHSHEGLNDQSYNRCIGTRYCANNCPYKVRRFNWFNNHRTMAEVQKMVFNPEVTVRSRGVMEKCTYCVQRIEAVKIAARNERRPVVDGEIVPACAQACPAQAIVFGDLNDPKSRVRRLHDDPRAYAMLGELNVRPRTIYLARRRNSRGPA